MQLVYTLTGENRQLKEDKRKISYIVDKIEKIERLERYLRRIARASGTDSKRNQFAHDAADQGSEAKFSLDSMNELLDGIKISSGEKMRDIQKKAETSELYFAALPNIQPVVEGWITRRYIIEANDSEQAHNGIDYAATQGTLIRATAPGVVDDVCNDRYFGFMLTIKHGYGISTRYGHCSQILITKGDHVERGQTVALVGNTGRSSAPHLHYEVLKDGKNVDPIKYIYNNESKE